MVYAIERGSQREEEHRTATGSAGSDSQGRYVTLEFCYRLVRLKRPTQFSSTTVPLLLLPCCQPELSFSIVMRPLLHQCVDVRRRNWQRQKRHL